MPSKRTNASRQPVFLSEEAGQVRAFLTDCGKSTDYLAVVDTWAFDGTRIKGLVDLCFSDDAHPYPQYASHLLLHVARKNPEGLAVHYDRLLDGVLATSNASVKRNGLGALLCLPLRPYREGDLLDWLFKVLQDPASAPGLITYAVRKLAAFSAAYPELKEEALMALELRAELSGNTAPVRWERLLKR